MTVAQLLTDHWLPAKQSQERSPATIDQYRNVIDGWILPHIGAMPVRQVTERSLQDLVELLRVNGSTQGRGGLSPRSRQMVVTVMKAATKWAVRTGKLSRDPLVGYERPSGASATMTAWTADQARAFLKATASDRLAAAWALLLTRGLRRGELAGLRWDAVDLEASRLQITATRVVVDGKAVDSTPKTKLSRRSVSLDPQLVALLRSHRARQGEERLKAGPAWSDTGHLFVNELGQPYHPDYFSDRFIELGESAKLRRIRLHDTRHTAASLMLAAGVPVKVVQEMLGHSSPTITLSIYAHVMPGMAESAGEALSALVLS